VTELAGQTVVLIGGSAGIGLETARRGSSDASALREEQKRRHDFRI
jgi:NAD(P)-dependent dehydrogenase (short-subunit alcohol dehydrogenase family)